MGKTVAERLAKASKKTRKKKLSSVPSELLDDALDHLTAALKVKGVSQNMDLWAQSESKNRCEACLGGATIMMGLGRIPEPGETIFDDDPRFSIKTVHRLWAIDTFRVGDILEACEMAMRLSEWNRLSKKKLLAIEEIGNVWQGSTKSMLTWRDRRKLRTVAKRLRAIGL